MPYAIQLTQQLLNYFKPCNTNVCPSENVLKYIDKSDSRSVTNTDLSELYVIRDNMIEIVEMSSLPRTHVIFSNIPSHHNTCRGNI